MSEVVALGEDWKPPAQNREELLDLLKDLLRRAEAGEIESIAFTTINPGGFTRCAWKRGSTRIAEIAGAVAALQHEIQMDWSS